MRYRITLDCLAIPGDDPPEQWPWAELIGGARLVQCLLIPDENQVTSAPPDIVMVLQGQVERLQKDVKHYKESFEGAVFNCETLVMQRNTAEGLVVAYRQALWDIYGILGFDQDGDPTPDALVAPPLIEVVVNAAKEFRAEYDELL